MITTTRLSNGITVIVEPMPNVRSVALGIYVEVGSAYETMKQNGISHLIEHMLFKGTTNRTAIQLANEMALIGDDINAYTAKEITCYYGKVLDEHLTALIDIFSDMLCNSLFNESDLEKEKRVILEEIDMYDDSPEDLVQEAIQKQVWSEHPLGYIISRNKEIVSSLTRDEVIQYWRQHYVGNKIVISLAGNIDRKKVIELVAEAFQRVPCGKPRTIPSKPNFEISTQQFTRDIEQTHLCLGFEGISHKDPQRYTASILNGVLGGSTNSRLFQEIREICGLCYSIYSFESSYHTTGILQIYAAMNSENIAKVHAEIMRILSNLYYEGIKEEELTHSKQQIRSENLLGQENSYVRMSDNAKNHIFIGDTPSVESIIKGIEQVKREEVHRFIQDYLQINKISYAVVGKQSNFYFDGRKK